MAFDTRLLDEALAQRRAQQEQDRRQTLDKVLRLLDKLGPRYRIRRAYIFGSVTRPGRFHADSDVDIAVEMDEPEHFFTAIGDLAAALGREVDLVDLNKCHFAHRIRQEGIVWTNPV